MAIRITNLHNGQNLCHSLAIITGDVLGTENIVSIAVKNESRSNESSTTWPVVGRHFKALIDLVPGDNCIVFSCYKFRHVFKLCYSPLKLQNYVRLLYIVCRNEDGRFQAPKGEDNSMSSAQRRVSLGAQMIQALTAELMVHSGFLRKTFQIEEDQHGKPICHVFRTMLTVDEVYSKCEKGEDLWSYLATEIMSSHLRDGDNCKFLAFLACTRYNNHDKPLPQTHHEVLERTKGHIMIGGGGLALCGTGCLHTWAEYIDEVPRRFSDLRTVDKAAFMDDSNYRGHYWSCYSTTLGAVMHELGHTFDLAHAIDGIMGQGFHDVHQCFCAKNPDGKAPVSRLEREVVKLTVKASLSWSIEPKQCCSTPQTPDMKDSINENIPPKKLYLTKLGSKDQFFYVTPHQSSQNNRNKGAVWSRSCAVILNYHRWFNPVVSNEICSPEFDGCRLTSKFGIRLVEFRDPETTTVIHYWEYTEGKEDVVLDHSNLKTFLPSSTNKLDMMLIDTCGNILKGVVSVHTVKGSEP